MNGLYAFASIAGELPVSARPRHAAIAVVDFGSQYSLLIARRIRELNTYCEVIPHDAEASALEHLDVHGFVLSGGPGSVYEADAPRAAPWVFGSGLPVLGICYGMQLMADQLGGRVGPGREREYGPAAIAATGESPLFAGLPAELDVWMSHGDRIEELPPGFAPLAASANSPVAVMADAARGYYGLQFHPEVAHTPRGADILANFAHGVCGAAADWTPGDFIAETVDAIRAQVGGGRVVCGLSGGVDSAVAATLAHRAIGDRLTCLFVDNGLLRAGEAEEVETTFRRELRMDLRVIDARERFLAALAEVTSPETKRHRIGAAFIEAFEAEARTIADARFLCQGTLYPDVIESASHGAGSARIKSHHNVGGLPERMDLELVEPLRFLFKDEVRRIGAELGLPDEILWRQPFPGPGLAVRVIGEVTAERLAVLRAADAIFAQEVRAAGLERDLWQSFAVLTDTRTVGVMGDFRTYGHAIALRAVAAEDAMTADWARLPHDLLARVSNRIVNEVDAVNRVVYDITSKPPGTIEWE